MSVLQQTLKPGQGNRGTIQQCFSAIAAAWQTKQRLLSDLWPVLLVPVFFAGFVVWNGGIVVGDKAAHAPVKHLMQPLYFALFTAAALGPFHFSPFR